MAETPASRVLTLRVSMLGREVKSLRFTKPVITIGRDPAADVFLDNPGISREHIRLERSTAGTYDVVDLGSANGTVLDDQPMGGRGTLKDGGSLRLGKFSLTGHYDTDRRENMAKPGTSPEADQHTMVLTRDELDKVMDLQRKAEVTPPTPPKAVVRAQEVASGQFRRAAVPTLAYTLAVFGLGAVTGASTLWIMLHH